MGSLKGLNLPPVPLASRLGPSTFLCWESFSPSHLLTCLSLTHPSDLDFKAHFPVEKGEVSLAPDRVQGPAMDSQGLYPHIPNRASSTQAASLNSLHRIQCKGPEFPAICRTLYIFSTPRTVEKRVTRIIFCALQYSFLARKGCRVIRVCLPDGP